MGQATAGMGSLSGVVTDASGAALAGASVVVSNPQKGITRAMLTTQAGLFSAPALVPSDGFMVRVEKQGFAPYEAADLTVQVGENLDLHVQLKLGGVKETVEVSAAAVILDDTKTEVSQVVDNQQIQDLPINGRRTDSFVLLTPAVTSDATFGLLTFRGMAGGNAFLTDGNDTTDQFYNENAGRTRLATQISGDAVQEFQVLTSSYSAEFGQSDGGTVNTITKSGGNDMHGTAFWFFRNGDLDARDRFATINPPEDRNQAGGTIGGPIKKDKLFFFLSTEFQRRNFPLVSSILGNANVNSTTQTWIGCGAPATPAQCAAINNLLPPFFGLVPRQGNENLYFAKIDYHLNQSNSISLSFNYLDWRSPDGIQTNAVLTGSTAIGHNGDDSVMNRYGRASWIFVPGSSVVNELRFGWFKDRQAANYDSYLETLYALKGTDTALSVGGASLSGYTILPYVQPSENRYQVIDNLSWTKGRHSLKLGFDIAPTEDYSNTLSSQFGSYNYSSVSSFAEDYANLGAVPSHYSTYSQTFGNPIVDTTLTNLGFYAQDAWKVTSKFTANLGLRYEYTVIPQPKIVNPAYPQTGVIPSDSKNFGPRIGLAYALNNKTVVRAGYGLFYARYETTLIQNLFIDNNLYTQSLSFSGPTQTGAPVFPNQLTSPAGTAGAASIAFAAPNLRNPYTEQGDLAIERTLGKGLTLTTSYVWNRGKRLWTARDLNAGPLSSTVYNFTIENADYQPTGQVYSTQIYTLANRVNSNFTRVVQVENDGKQWYDAMVVQLRKKLGHGFLGTVDYTWSHELDEDQGQGAGALSFSSPSSMYNGNYGNDKGTGVLDQRHRLVSTFTAQPKFGGNSRFARYILNNWQWNGILTLASGRPSAETVGFSSTSNLPQASSGSLDGFGSNSSVPWLPINPLMTQPITRFDTRLSRVIPIRERMKVYLSFEVFNLTNTQTNTGVNSAGFTAANKGTVAAPNLVIAPCASATATVCSPETPGWGNSSAGWPDGTSARRGQVGARFVF
jgi:outer membrane receptor protein involved in Fe transport